MGYKTIKTRVTGFFNPIKKKAIDVTSDILSAPARMAAQKKITAANQLTDDIKLVRKTKGMQMDNADFNDPVTRARTNVANAKFDNEVAMKKAAKNLR